MSEDLIIGLVIGWTLGTVVMWAHFSFSGLIRSREEWMVHRIHKAKSLTELEKIVNGNKH